MKTLNRRAFLQAAFAMTLAATLPKFASAEITKQDRPNVLFIAIDDLRPSLGCYGDALAKTPNIDRLANSALQFNRAYCQQSVCGPSRVSMLTGRLPDHTGVWHNRNLFRDKYPDIVTLPQLFKNNGYHAQSLGKVFSGNPRTAEQDPQSWSVPPLLRAEDWQRYALPENAHLTKKGPPTERADVPDEAYEDGKLAELAIETLVALEEGDQPFFLAVGFFKPHLPFNAPQQYWDLYRPEDFDLPFPLQRTEGAPDLAYPDHLELGGYEGVPKDENTGPAQTRELRHGYYACISYVDAQVGKVLDAVDRLGLADNTIVVLWGDHGYSLGEAAHWCKDTNFELDTRVPLIIRAPEATQPATTTEALIENVDIYPTLAELAALTPPNGLDGQSLIPILRNPLHSGREAVLSQFSRPFEPSEPDVMGYSIRTSTHRYTRWINFQGQDMLSEELYDYGSAASVLKHQSFLVERKNLVDDPAYTGLHAEMRLRLFRMLETRGIAE